VNERVLLLSPAAFSSPPGFITFAVLKTKKKVAVTRFSLAQTTQTKSMNAMPHCTLLISSSKDVSDSSPGSGPGHFDF